MFDERMVRCESCGEIMPLKETFVCELTGEEVCPCCMAIDQFIDI